MQAMFAKAGRILQESGLRPIAGDWWGLLYLAIGRASTHPAMVPNVRVRCPALTCRQYCQ